MSRPKNISLIFRISGLLLCWFLLSIFPDPGPRATPSLAVELIQSLFSLPDSAARMITAIVLRGLGLSLLGVLLVNACRAWRSKYAFPILLAGTWVMVVTSQWIQYGYFPISQQLFLGTCSTVFGVILGFMLLRSRRALLAMLCFLTGLYLWGSSTRVSNTLSDLTSDNIAYLLGKANEVPDGDAGWIMLTEEAFIFADENANQRNLILHQQAAILALSVILGEEKVAGVARREISPETHSQCKALRKRITLYGRKDLSQHYWVSAGLAVLSSEQKAMTVGISKEMMDADGGSGFSFVDLTVDRAGTLLTASATRNKSAAHALQKRIRQGVVLADFCPNPLDLPEGIQLETFTQIYGGLGGPKTTALVNEIKQRLADCAALQ